MAVSVSSLPNQRADLRGKCLFLQRPLPAYMGNGRSRPDAVIAERQLSASSARFGAYVRIKLLERPEFRLRNSDAK